MDIIEQVRQMKLDEARREGMKAGIEDVKRRCVTNMLTKTSCSVVKIAKLVGVSEAYVNKVKASLKK